jgi:peptidoglycan/LPS O-acetylase OafA/YrhL
MDTRSANLDFARGIAAFAVVLGHLLVSVFRGPSPAPEHAWMNKLFTVLTALPYEAVMIFFVISGYFVGGSVIRASIDDRWSWLEYLTRRLIRLWMVLLPALLLTAMWDHIGITHGDVHYYRGARDGIGVFLGNLFFQQLIIYPVYGSNGPVWSLANEFWYYILFPLIFRSFIPSRTRPFQGPLLLAAVLLMLLLPKSLVAGGLVWLMGTGSYLCVTSPRLKHLLANYPVFIASSLLFLWILWDPVSLKFPWPHYTLGLTFALMVPFLATRSCPWETYHRFSTWISGISYTLYLVHFPFMIFVFYGVGLPFQQEYPSSDGFVRFGAILLVILLYTQAVWYLFERNTSRFRGFVLTRIIPRAERALRRSFGR